MSQVDVLLTLLIIGAAIGFLVWRLSSRGPAPACHSAPRSSPTDDVVIGAALARGLKGAQARRRR